MKLVSKMLEATVIMIVVMKFVDYTIDQSMKRYLEHQKETKY